jgi:hypothetical protein
VQPYKEVFQEGSKVRVAPQSSLEAFKRDWKLHHPLDDGQFVAAGRTYSVKGVSFYHGGDVMYELAGAPGIWHEQCLTSAD